MNKLEKLLIAVENGDLDNIKLLGEDKDFYENIKYKILDKAISCNQIEIVKYLVENNKDIVSQSAINLCVDNNNTVILDFLTTKETVFSIDDFDRIGQCGALDVFKFMIGHAIENEYEKFDFYTGSFIEALNNENLELIKYLVSQEPSLIEYDDYFCLRSSVSSDNVEITQFLLDNGADIEVAQDFVYQDSNVDEYLKRRPLEKKLNKELPEKESIAKKIKV